MDTKDAVIIHTKLNFGEQILPCEIHIARKDAATCPLLKGLLAAAPADIGTELNMHGPSSFVSLPSASIEVIKGNPPGTDADAIRETGTDG